ncbi:MAG: ATP-binding protein, partial [Pseudomonadota bacterium]|nr:ATP-binding protein [Pseudomonadota bacterium]
AAELLQEPLPEAERARFAANVQSQGERLTEMIDKLLALASVEHRTQLQQREPVDLPALIEGIAEDIAPRLAQAGMTLHQIALPGLKIEGDAFLLRQAIRNLLDNAIEFSTRGSTIDLELRNADGHVEVVIGDRGPGVPDYARDRIFERFYSLSRPDGGSRSSGLGLPFVREVALLHGGSIELKDRAGGGTQAILRLP